MKLIPTLKAIVMAGTIAVAGSSCKPTQDKHKAEVERILNEVNPTSDDIRASSKYYESRKDLKDLTEQDQVSLAWNHAKISVLAEGVKTGKISLRDFFTILQSKDHIITDEYTKIKISTTPGFDIKKLSVVGNEIEISTGKETADIIRNPNVEVSSKGGTTTFTFTGEGYKCLYKGRDKSQTLARDKATLTSTGGDQSTAITLSLVLKH